MVFFEEYFKYVGESEAPASFHRWCALATLSAMIGRAVFLPFGHKPIYPNQYILLMGDPGTRKSSAIGIAREVLEKASYKTFAKDRTSKERFFVDLSMNSASFESEDLDLEALVIDAPSEVLIANGEFLDFIGHGNMEFLTVLTTLWDNLQKYEHPKMHGRSVIVDRPTINILGGATVKGLGLAIPPEALGTGILSRLLLVHADITSHKIAFPEPPSATAADTLIEMLQRIRKDIKGAITRTPAAEKLLSRMYNEFPGIEDGRFADYTARRFIHLLKITMLIAISNFRTEITSEDTLLANTILHAAEIRMPKGLGEFGKSKFSDVSNTIMNILNNATKPKSHTDLWKKVSKDLSDIRDLGTVMKNLLTADKVQILTVAGKQGYLPKHSEQKHWAEDLLLPDYLTLEERSF